MPRTFLVLSAFVLAPLAACSVAASAGDEALRGGQGGSTSTGGSTGTTTGAGGSGGSVDWTPDGGAREDGGGAASLASLCGPSLPCVPGPEGNDAACQGGNPGTGGAGGGPGLACQLVPDGSGSAVPVCGVEGLGLAGDPCTIASDCADGLGCVTDPTKSASGGQCRAYCCGDPEACAGGTYCAVQHLAELSEPKTPVPACIPATGCELLGDPAQCPEGTSCAVVKADGTTSCLEPGVGEACEACPCAAGYVCSAAMNQCKKLCHTDGQYGDECGGGYCQGGFANLPGGIGICAGDDGC